MTDMLIVIIVIINNLIITESQRKVNFNLQPANFPA